MIGIYARALFCGFLALLVELVLARVLDYSLNSFASWLCISAALFGVGLGGFLYTWRPFQKGWNWFLLGLILIVFPKLHNALSFEGDIWKVAANYSVLVLLLSAPFALAGMALLQIFSRSEASASQIYFFDLVGGALGALAAYFLIGPLAPGQILALTGLGCLVISQGGIRQKFAGVLCLPFCWLIYSAKPFWWEFEAKSAKRFSSFLESAKPERTLWTPLARVDIVDWNNGRKQMVYDGGEMVSTIYPFDGDFAKFRSQIFEKVHTDFWSPSVVVSHYLKEGTAPKVLALGAAGGQEVKAALTFGASAVDVVEIMGELTQLSQTEYSSINGGIFLRPEVRVFTRDGREHLRSLGEKQYDIIQLFSVHGSSSRGSSMGALQISPLVTVEAFSDYFSHLSGDGILHLNHPYYPRLITTISEAWEKLGKGPLRSHVVVVQSGGQRDYLTTVLVKMSPWSTDEISRLHEFYTRSSTGGRSFKIQEDPLGAGHLGDQFFDGRWREVDKNLPYRIFPATDSKPYFKFLRKSPFVVEAVEGAAVTPDIEFYLNQWRTGMIPGDVYPLVLMAIGAICVFVFVLQIACHQYGRRKRRWSEAAYFFLTGFGFIALETFFVYRATLWLGSPHAAMALGLGLALVFAGIGGLLSRWNRLWTCGLTVVAAVLASFLAHGSLVLPALALVGLFMGMPFIAGVKSMGLSGNSRAQAFLISGIGAGFGGMGAVFVSLIFGFPAVLLSACAAYLTAAAVQSVE